MYRGIPRLPQQGRENDEPAVASRPSAHRAVVLPFPGSWRRQVVSQARVVPLYPDPFPDPPQAA